MSSLVALKSVHSILGRPSREKKTKGSKEGYREANWAKSGGLSEYLFRGCMVGLSTSTTPLFLFFLLPIFARRVHRQMGLRNWTFGL